jgi:hypothetical protein
MRLDSVEDSGSRVVAAKHVCHSALRAGFMANIGGAPVPWQRGPAAWAGQSAVQQRGAVRTQAGDSLKAKADQAGKKAQNAVGNTSQLPSPQDVRHIYCQIWLIYLCCVLMKSWLTESPSGLLVSSASQG